MKIGIPRALLYYRYNLLWETFFHELDCEIVLSPHTNKTILDAGNQYSIDENCLSSKLFFGHVSTLENKCDAVFVPRYANFGDDGVLCTRFEALYDMCVNTFRDKNLKFITCDVDIQQKHPEEDAYASLGPALGKTTAEAKAAYRKARIIWEAHNEKKIDQMQERMHTGHERIKILVVGHSYNLYDEYIGLPILKGIENLDAIPVVSDAIDLSQAQTDSLNICKYVPWVMSRELLGAIEKYHDEVDGIILITAFPCGPDSMVNEMIIRRVKDLPILNLLLDSQDGNAGIETRLESFIDIIRFRKGMRF